MGTQHLVIKEIFSSIQGEGKHMGIPMTFIRLTGCNLRCEWCDTRYAYKGGKKFTIAGVIQAVKRHKLDHVCVTGGEPLCQDNTRILIRGLLRLGYHVTLETNGSYSISGLARQRRLCVSMDVKTPSSGESSSFHEDNLRLLGPQDQLKFVIANKKDFNFMVRFIKTNNPPCETIAQPLYGKNIKTLAGWVNDSKLHIRVLPQLHKLIWGNKKGV